MAATTPNGLADDLLAVHAERGPVEASLAGLPGYDDRPPDPADAAEQALASRAADIAGRARRLDPAALKCRRPGHMHGARRVIEVDPQKRTNVTGRLP